jgi:formate dehydrogenase alpha subunit
MNEHIAITIDGQEIKTVNGANLLQVALDHGIDIPHLCYHRKLSATGACRLCLVKIEGRMGLITSCTVKTEPDMNVTAFDRELEDYRKHILDYLLSEHNEANDDTYDDEFRQLARRYGLDQPGSRVCPSLVHELHLPMDNTSPVLSYDSSKCIKCFRCIKACGEVQGKHVLSFSDRGIDSTIVAGIDHWRESECDGCGECVQLCPTGAIVEAPDRKTYRRATIDRQIVTTCPYCGVGCQLELHVHDGKIVRSIGVEGILPNDGRLCVKGRFGYQFVSSPERLTNPLIKRNGGYVEASWDEALALVAERFSSIREEYGPDALAGYSSAKCTNEDNYMFQKFIRVAFGTNNLDYCTRLCHASTVVAMLRSIGDGAGSNSIQDFEYTDCLIVTGNNMIETHPVTATYVKRGVARGMNVIVIDPKWTPMVNHAYIWLQPKLGTDVALLNGMIHVIIREDLIDEDFIRDRVEGGMEAFKELKELAAAYTPAKVEDITGVPHAKIIEAARLYAGAPTAMIATGMGMSQQVTGTNNVFSLINMMLITGQIGKERAGIAPPRGQNNVQGATDVGASPIFYPGYIPVQNEKNLAHVASVWGVTRADLSSRPGLSTVEIMQAAYREEVKGLYIMGENPMLTDPNLNHTEAALENLDFLVVQDIFHTDTTPFADVILPAASFAEKNGTFVNSDRRVLRVRKAVESPGSARNDWEILAEVARRMGHPIGNYENEEEIFNELTTVTPIMAGVTYDRIQSQGIQWPCPDNDHPGTSTLFLDRFNTPNGKAKLNPVHYVPQDEQADEDYPFMLNSGRILYQYHTSTMSRKSAPLKEFANQSYVLMHPHDAIKQDFSDGDPVRLTSRRGTLETVIKVSDRVLEGELFMPFHFNESPVNRLTRDQLDPHSKIAPFKLSACRVEKIGTH